MYKKIISFIVTAVLVLSMGTVAFASEPAGNTNEITPYDMDVASGKVIDATEYSGNYSLKSANGKNVNFWIKNNSSVEVKISINGKASDKFKPGESGHITASVGFLSSNYTFKAVPVSSTGGRISIEYKIAQRD